MDVGESYEYELALAPAGDPTDVVSPLFQAFADANVRSWCLSIASSIRRFFSSRVVCLLLETHRLR